MLKITGKSSEGGLEGRMFASKNRALSTMGPCKLKKQVVRQHLKSSSESNSSGDKVFVDKEAKSMEKSPYCKSPGPLGLRESSGEEHIGLRFTL